MSVIIPTKNRPSDLSATVESLLTQTRAPDELIIVDQSAVPCFRTEIAIPTRYIHNATLSGASEARNVAMRVATGDIWLFLDDDVILEPTFVEQLLAAYSPETAGVSGIVTNYRQPPWKTRLWDALFVRGVFHDDRQAVYRNAEIFHNCGPIRVRKFGAGLMSFRSSVIRDLAFDPNLTGSSPGEDLDFCARLPKGSVLVIAPKARLVHKQSPQAREQVRWLSLHAQVSFYMWMRHWRHNPWNSLFFLWLNVGYTVAAAFASLTRGSLDPWRAWWQGARTGVNIAASKSRSDK